MIEVRRFAGTRREGRRCRSVAGRGEAGFGQMLGQTKGKARRHRVGRTSSRRGGEAAEDGNRMTEDGLRSMNHREHRVHRVVRTQCALCTLW